MLGRPVGSPVGSPVGGPVSMPMFGAGGLYFSALAPGEGLHAPKAVDGTATPPDLSGSTHGTWVWDDSENLIFADTPAGCLPEYGSRMVKNIINHPTKWHDIGDAVLTDNGDETYTLTGAGTDESHCTRDATPTNIDLESRDFIFTVELKGVAGKVVQLKLKRNGGGADNPVTTNVTLTADWQRFSTTIFTGVSGNLGLRWALYGGSGDSATTFDIRNPQIEDVTGFANQAPGEYVSVGVVTGPNMQADDYSSGTGSWIPYGSNVLSNDAGAVKLSYVNNNSGAYLFMRESADQSVDLIVGATYRLSCEYKVSGGNTADIKIAGGASGDLVVNVTNTDYETGSVIFLATSTTSNYLLLVLGTSQPDIWIRNIFISRLDHGNNADGLKFFNTKNGNTVDGSGVVTEAIGDAIPEADMFGVFMELEAANNVTEPRDFSHADWIKTTVTAVQDAVGIDGTTNASTLTATAGNGTCFHTFTVLSAEFTTSFYVRRKTGTGTIEITDNGGANYTDITSLINSSTYTLVSVTRTQANPQVGFRIVTDTDAIEVDAAQIEEGAVPTSPILTGGATRTSSQELAHPIENVPGPVGAQELSFECEWTPVGYSFSDMSANAAIVTLKNAWGSEFLYLLGTGEFRSYDGTNLNTDNSLNWVAGVTYRIRLTASTNNNQMGLMVAGGTDKTTSFDGAFSVTDAIRFFKSAIGGNAIKNVKFWNKDKGDDWRQAA